MVQPAAGTAPRTRREARRLVHPGIVAQPAPVPLPAQLRRPRRGVRPRVAFRPDVEGLRAVAVVLVVAFHAGFGAVPGGFVGVDVAIASRGAYKADDRVTVVEGGRGAFAPGETKTYTLFGASQRVRALRGGRIRLAADAEG